jgi:single-strand DNA-binding protein
MNTIHINGNLGKDPELKYNSAGNAICKLSVASRYKPKSGEEETTWFTVIAFGDLAEHVAESLSSGLRVSVSGRFRKQKWEKKDGTMGYSDEVIAQDISVDLRFQTVEVQKGGRPAPKQAQAAYVDEEPF